MVEFIDAAGKRYKLDDDLVLRISEIPEAETPPEPEQPVDPETPEPVEPEVPVEPEQPTEPEEPEIQLKPQARELEAVRSGPRAAITWEHPDSGPPLRYRVARDGTDRNGNGPWSTEIEGVMQSFVFFGLVDDQSYALTVTPVTDEGDGRTNTVAVPAATQPTQPEPTHPEPTPPQPRPEGKMTLDRLVYVSWGEHEAKAEGLNPGWDWAVKGRGGRELRGHAVSGWGQIFAVPGTPTYDVDLDQRNFQLWFLRSNGTWFEPKPLVNPEPEGAYWDARFGGIGKAPVRRVQDAWTTPMNRLAEPAVVTFHWWWKGFYPRIPVPNDVVGCAVWGEMRLAGPNAAHAKMIGSIAADVYDGPTTVRSGEQIAAMSQPRMCWVTPDWQTYGGVSYTKSGAGPISPEQLRDNPPPFVVR